jgi:beta-glucanase (GH16 family)
MRAHPRGSRPTRWRAVGVGAAVALLILAATVGLNRRRDFSFVLPCGGRPVIELDGTQHRCTFDDEFDGSAVDPGKWQVLETTQYGFHTGQECFVADHRHVSVANGMLRLTATRSAQAQHCVTTFSTPYRSGMITSTGRFAQRYGRFVVRAELPRGAGVQPAVWMYPQQLTYGPWPDSGEIDIAEAFGSATGQAWPHLHYLGADGQETHPGQACDVHGRAAGFHTYAVDWTPSSFRFTYDGATCLTVGSWTPAPPLAAPAPFDRPFYLLLELATGVGSNAPTAATILPRSLLVDYVRVWA